MSEINIKDIAKLSGVSPSTVSKVINGKDENISDDTRQRILDIVKEYNYKPYDAIRSVRQERSFVIGILLSAYSPSAAPLMSIIKTARECGYGTIIYDSSSPEEESKNLHLLASHQVDGIIWERLPDSVIEPDFPQSELGIPAQLMDYSLPLSVNNLIIDYESLGEQAAQELINLGHEKILCLSDLPHDREPLFLSGVGNNLQKNNIPFTEAMCKRLDDCLGELAVLLFQYTAVVCSSGPLAMTVYEECVKKNRRIPKSLSIIALQEEGIDQPNITVIEVPVKELGAAICQRIINAVEKRSARTDPPAGCPKIIGQGRSTAPPQGDLGGKIVVVGSINMDLLLSMNTLPRSGETIPAHSRAMIPGGKGVNQAIGAAKLDAQVNLIGKMGADFDGSIVHDYLYKCGVNTTGISSTQAEPTGAAYIYIQEDGESQIVIHDGANKHLAVADIQNNEELFRGADFCLVQTEISQDIVLEAVKIAKKNNNRVLLKPAAVRSISPEIYAYVDIFLPNEKEAEILCPDRDSIEARGEYFRSLGPQTVIITMAGEGLYISSDSLKGYYPAFPFEALDTTGAADAFASALAVYLSRGAGMEKAIGYASCAAGYSVTKQGVPPALIDRNTLEFYMSTHSKEASLDG